MLPHEKDDTDSYYAAKEALRRGYRDFLLLGASGARLDHTLGNLALLLMLHEAGARALLVDDYAEMEIVAQEGARVSDRYPYFSLFNLDGSAGGVTVTGAKYPLCGAALPCDSVNTAAPRSVGAKNSAPTAARPSRRSRPPTRPPR